MKLSDLSKAFPSEVDQPTIALFETLESFGLTIGQTRKVLQRADMLAERVDEMMEYYCGHCGTFLFGGHGGFLTQDTCRNCGVLNRFTARKVLGVAELPPNHICDHASHNLRGGTPSHIPLPAQSPA